jgi:hypothetical protein
MSECETVQERRLNAEKELADILNITGVCMRYLKRNRIVPESDSKYILLNDKYY